MNGLRRERGEAAGKRERGNEDEKGSAGRPVNSWTMARKLEVSVVNTVVNSRRVVRDRFLELREAAASRGAEVERCDCGSGGVGGGGDGVMGAAVDGGGGGEPIRLGVAVQLETSRFRNALEL